MGFITKGSVDTDIQDLVLWQISHIGIWGYSRSNAPTISNVRMADFHVGSFWGNIGGNSNNHVVYQQTLTYRNSLFVARSYNNPRDGTSRALLLPIFSSQGYSISPSTCGP